MKLNLRTLAAAILMLTTSIIHAQYKESEWKERDSWMSVSEIFKLADINTGSAVADVGCHEGYLTVHMAKKVGPEGKVYAVDIKKSRLDALDEHLKDRNLNNVETILGDYDDPKLPEATLDVVVVMDTYHEIRDYMLVLKHIKKSLKPDGRIVLIEKLRSHMRNKTREQQAEGHTLAMKYVKKELQEAGFSISKKVENFGKWENDSKKQIWVLVGEQKENQ